MSLRQLKFKPKIQLNSAAKNKSDDCNSKPSIKVTCNSKNDETSESKPIGTEVLVVEEIKEKKKSPQELSGLNNDVPLSSKDCETNDTSKRICKSGCTFPESIGKDISANSETISKNLNTAIPPFPTSASYENDSTPSLSGSGSFVDNLNVSSSSTTTPSQSQQKSSDGPMSQSGSDSEDNVTSILVDSNKKSMINYDVLNKISLISSPLINSQNHDRLNTVDKDKQDVLPNNGSKINLIDSKEKVNDSKKSEKNKSLECEIDTSSVKVSNVLNKENLESSSLKKSVICSVKSHCGPKNTKRRKCEGKNTDVSPNKVNALQRANFKPNVVALGKIRRPEKFTTSSYSKMGSLAKEQFLKKFGNEQEPDTSKLTMMDLIFYNPSTNPMPQSSDKKLLSSLKNSTNAEKEEGKNTGESPDKERNDNSEDTDGNADDILPVPQLKISADGKVIVAQESLVIQPSNNLENCTFETVIDSELKKRKPIKNPNRCGWSHEDTIKFYKALNSLGCDFETMQSIFPDRSRKNLKSKFKKEEKLHGSLINKVLSRHSEFDLTNVVRELEIDTVYKDTIKNYGRRLTENEKKRSKGRKKSLSSVVAGKASKKNGCDESDDSISDEEFCKKKKKVDPEVLSKMSEVLGLNDKNDSSGNEVGDNLSNSGASDQCNLKDTVTTKRTRKKLRDYLESDSDFEKDLEISDNKNSSEEKNTGNQSLRRAPKITVKRKKVKPNAERIPTKRIVLRLEELIDFNDGSVVEPQSKSEPDVINDNHIVINTNIEFENVKYTRYISYNSNNLENPIEINETVAHVD